MKPLRRGGDGRWLTQKARLLTLPATCPGQMKVSEATREARSSGAQETRRRMDGFGPDQIEIRWFTVSWMEIPRWFGRRDVPVEKVAVVWILSLRDSFCLSESDCSHQHRDLAAARGEPTQCRRSGPTWKMGATTCCEDFPSSARDSWAAGTGYGRRAQPKIAGQNWREGESTPNWLPWRPFASANAAPFGPSGSQGGFLAPVHWFVINALSE